MTFGEKLQALRQAASLTQAEIARLSNIPIGTLRDYEQDRRIPAFDRVMILTKTLGSTCEAFQGCEFKYVDQKATKTGEADSASAEA